MKKFWSIDTDPKKPTGIKDPNAILDYPIDYTNWLSAMSDNYLSHTISTTGGLTVVSSSYINGSIIPVLSGGTLGTTASFTISIVTVSGKADDRTFYLTIEER